MFGSHATVENMDRKKGKEYVIWKDIMRKDTVLFLVDLS